MMPTCDITDLIFRVLVKLLYECYKETKDILKEIVPLEYQHAIKPYCIPSFHT